MEREDILLLAQLLHAMREISDKLEQYFADGDFAGVVQAKRELVRLQRKVGELL